MCYVYAVVPQHGFIWQKNRNYEIIMLLACIDMMCLCVDAMDQHKKQAYSRVRCFFLCPIDVVNVPHKKLLYR